jgi:hypothetical protein
MSFFWVLCLLLFSEELIADLIFPMVDNRVAENVILIEKKSARLNKATR